MVSLSDYGLAEKVGRRVLLYPREKKKTCKTCTDEDSHVTVARSACKCKQLTFNVLLGLLQ